MQFVSEFVFGTYDAAFVQAMYEDYLRDPASVGQEWRELFDNGRLAELPVIPEPPGARSAVSGTRESTPPPAPEPPAHPSGATPITGPAARLVANMTDSLSVPTATSFRDISATVLDTRRKALNAQLAATGKKISFTHLIGYAIVQAAKRFPVMTHTFQDIDGKPYRVNPGAIGLGLAVDVEKKDGSRALVVPVIKHAETMDFATFHAAYEALVEKARTNRLMPDDFAGGTIQLTNPGTLGTVASVPRLIKGQGSIIATGTIREIAGAKIITITSTYDHRIIQGAESGMFLRHLDSLLQGEERFYEGVTESLAGGEAGRGKGEGYTPAPPTPAPVASSPPPSSPVPPPQPGGVGIEDLKHVAAAYALVRAHRNFGHLAAHLDPLGSEPPGDPSLDTGRLGLTPVIMARIPVEVLRIYVPGKTLAEALPALHATYCGTIAYEVEHIGRHEERVWLRQVIESGEHRRPLSAQGKRQLLARLTAVETLERFLHKAYLGQKRFSIEGLDMTVPMLDFTLELAAAHGTRKAVIGMAHRGRLNVLAHVVNVPYETILAEFEGGHREETAESEGWNAGTGDVKYHHGAEGVYKTTIGKDIAVTLSPNPSHLESVNPVVEGRARADQTDRQTPEAKHDWNASLPVLLHGDASFAGQGVVAETFNLARLQGYTTGGTIHLILNNQIGFTTEPREARSTDYSSDLAKGFDVPIIHVNADDAEACLAAVRLALMYREKFHADVVIDLVGYRRYGHNEADEPAYTQPVMYERIKPTPSVRQKYAAQLASEGVVDSRTAEADAEAAYQRLATIQQAVKSGQRAEEPQRIKRESAPEPATAVAADLLKKLNDELVAVPDGFTVHPKLLKQLERRRDSLTSAEGIEWAHAEALALASLLVDGTPIRLTGQDTERGTFSQRHLVLHDIHNGNRHAPIQHLRDAKTPFELHNSPLSEYGCLGFEYGYAVEAQNALVLWEAQFGDFANGAEVIIDQFLIAGLAKWGETSRLTLLLPHGYEGQGPEHSSARLERFLALGAEGNIRVANCTTPAQYFHLLRRQALHAEIRPLVLMTPKSLLRLPAAASQVNDLVLGKFRTVLWDRDRTWPEKVTRLVLCSGKVYYDIVASPRRAQAPQVKIGRVELLYPFPGNEIGEYARRYPNLKEVVWVQEEPRNMGARKFVLPKIRDLLPKGVTLLDVSRPERSSPAEGYPAAHKVEQDRIVAAAYGS
ncbi:MAG: multifunctional oxoglutarate decarboxylase/oxoglutarate dehydrogenase thiamine pyrophosphate-binding subunit/dihydrolipoyllysine-residue succinyltransferase subunit [Gemmatimonadetes bacterium]|nr:MAG: multifunctional oxoglutarate decarboxylase/oxoglutarate dehydrogenase thiamine pyrophosphate-binding subunit/dihydrolipoyllysine-residue succinyltransferase subunit [Gemmatimonadota bacterium]